MVVDMDVRVGFVWAAAQAGMGFLFDGMEFVVSKLIERVQKHAVDVDGCWEWQGALQYNGKTTPTMRWDGKVGAVRRFLAAELGLDLRSGRLATSKCGNWLCVHPEHVQTITRAKLSARIAKERSYGTNPVRMQKLAENARARSKLNIQIAQEIREAEGSQRAIAKKYGISQHTVNSIKRGKTWRDYTSPFTQLMKGLFR